MMKTDQYYSTLSFEVNDKELKASVIINREHPIHNGHFPEQPVVPGVMQLQIVKELLESMVQSPLVMKNMPQTKFLNMIIPDEEPINIHLQYKTTEEGSFGVDASLSKHGQTTTKIKALYRLKNESFNQ